MKKDFHLNSSAVYNSSAKKVALQEYGAAVASKDSILFDVIDRNMVVEGRHSCRISWI